MKLFTNLKKMEKMKKKKNINRTQKTYELFKVRHFTMKTLAHFELYVATCLKKIWEQARKVSGIIKILEKKNNSWRNMLQLNDNRSVT